uniref:O-acyltransferase like n=1 Tax=Sphaeramia orbicularis TaxID=375764 RepID=A0A672YYK5_9TELE
VLVVASLTQLFSPFVFVATAVSPRCLEDTNTFLLDMNQHAPKEYAVRMYDAFGKMGSNVEGGNANRPGLLLQCRSARAPTFSGRYCQVFLRQGTLQYFVGICVPDSCGEEDVQLGQTSLIPPLPSILINQSTQEMIMTHCLSNTITPDASDVTCLLVYTWIYLSLPSTLKGFKNAPLNFKFNLQRPKHPLVTKIIYCSKLFNTFSSVDRTSHTVQCVPQSCLQSCLQAFSLQTTTPGVLSITSSIREGRYSSLNGIRVLSLLWIICGHSAQFPVISTLDNYKNWKKAVESSPLYVFTISGPVFLAVDTFLLLGGLLSARSLLGSIHTADDKLNELSFPALRSRIQPLHIFIMCLTISLISVVQWGPYWFPFIDTMMDCKSYWWANVLLISNLLPVHEICVPWTWYLSLDFQCYATTPLLWQALLGWFCCLWVLALLVGLAYILKETPAFPSVPHALYQGLHRPLWALAIAWIILACEEGYGGFIQSLLSLRFWIPLSNISFACYLTHPVFIIIYIGLQETPIHYTNINFMYMFFGHLMLTLVLSYAFTVLVEKPYLLLKLNMTKR